MTSEIKQAFAHPEMRSIATARDEVADRISLRDHVVEVEIGAFQTERGLTQRISFDVVVEVRDSSGAETDDVDDILSYARVTEAIDTEVFSERLNLLETLAERIALRILSEPQALRVFVRIQKLDKDAGKLGVEIVRSKEDLEVSDVQQSEIPATVIHFNKAVLKSENLSGWLDQIEAAASPCIITVEGDTVEVGAKDVPARRIELLSIEQNAWHLAQLDTRCVVVDSWTELDWGLKNGQLSVWAPSKTVFDSPEPEPASMLDAQQLSQWLAVKLEAKHVMQMPSSVKLIWEEEQ